MPVSIAADIFSGNPPAAPLSLVTINLAPVCFIIAMFNSFENGPCIAITCLPSSPALVHVSIACTDGSTLAVIRFVSFIPLQNICKSLLPVVNNILPVVLFRYFAACMVSGNVIILSLFNTLLSVVPRKRRK